MHLFFVCCLDPVLLCVGAQGWIIIRQSGLMACSRWAMSRRRSSFKCFDAKVPGIPEGAPSTGESLCTSAGGGRPEWGSFLVKSIPFLEFYDFYRVFRIIIRIWVVARSFRLSNVCRLYVLTDTCTWDSSKLKLKLLSMLSHRYFRLYSLSISRIYWSQLIPCWSFQSLWQGCNQVQWEGRDNKLRSQDI